MTSLEEKAETPPDIVLARDSAQRTYRVLDVELESADELTPEGEFPQHGDFLPTVEASGPPGEPSWPDGDLDEVRTYVECPASLASWLVDHGAEDGFEFRIVSVRKVDGVWSYELQEVE